MIKDEEVAAYRRDGVLVVEDVLDAAQLAEARRVVAELIEGSRAVTAHTDVYDLEPGHTADAPRVRRIKTPHKHHPLFWDIARSPRLVSILQALLGPGVRLHGSKINLKSPQFGSPVEWHQDWAFYPHTNDDILAVGVMLDDCTVENGAMLVLPDTHRGPVYDHHSDGYFCGAMDPEACGLDFSRAVPAVGRAGSMSFHHVRAVHGSAQNTSDKPRALLLYEFAASDAWPLSGVPDLAAFDSRIVAGEPTTRPRLADVPVRMPLPPAPRQGSIYENQTTAKSRYFADRKTAA
ncbi:phytanoyl-CoA dioxygenase family protein [Inquilinus limosus]|uniref:Phytanoyl-CoA dioxygenase n=1 Tax=Inquilinus limosus MP06 TaxID=1398085 RepID=A0A0A0D9Y2_9PROT|nr:phytanoyl-CoA dioxygenase family protein [Inquilinus limosus]KGM35541.1 phytanoyl-CoA dioxygenase [Inquilinus limosus MP06]